MNVVWGLVAICLLIGALILAINNPVLFTFFWSIFGCSYDGCGIVMYLDSYLGFYRLTMNYIILLCCLLSIIRFYKKNRKKVAKRFMIVAILFMIGILISEISVFIICSISIINISYGLVEYGPLIFIIWLANYERFNKKNDSRRIITSFVAIQIIIAVLIVYLPQIGVHVLDHISGSNYISDGYVYNKNILLNILELPKIFANKYMYNGLGQFHNGNDMGFYGTVGLLLAISIIIKEQKIGKRLLGIGFVYLSLLLWGNSGMRGPVAGLICGVSIFYILWKKPSKWIIGFLSILMLTMFLFSEIGNELILFLLPQANSISFTGRHILRVNGMEYLKHNWAVGAGGLIANLTSQNIDPHELPLRISCLFGVLTGIWCVVLIYIYPIITFVRIRKKDSIIIVFWMIVFFVSITNNYTCSGLFWILFSETICSMCYKCEFINNKIVSTNNDEKTYQKKA